MTIDTESRQTRAGTALVAVTTSGRAQAAWDSGRGCRDEAAFEEARSSPEADQARLDLGLREAPAVPAERLLALAGRVAPQLGGAEASRRDRNPVGSDRHHLLSGYSVTLT